MALHARLEALFGRNRDHQRKRNLFQRGRPEENLHHHRDDQDEFDKLFSDRAHTEKEILHGSTFGFASMQGWRSTMEDKHKFLIPLDHYAWKFWSFFAIFDGHNGIDTAKHSADHLDIYLLHALNKMLEDNGYHESKYPEAVRSSELNLDQLKNVIKETYYQLDQNLRRMVKDESGCVCITCLIGPEQIYLINIGDSRAIIFSAEGQILAFTEDHKPDDPAEQERIHEAGGTISKPCAGDVLRVENQLAMTRVLGDFAMDKQIVPPMADIVQFPRKSSAAFVVLACDGIWDVMSNEDVAMFVSQRTLKLKLEEIASQLVDECLHRKSTDNMSVYIVKL